MKNLDTKLYLVTDSTGLAESEFLGRVESALKGGVTLLQLREKETSTREYMSLAERVLALAHSYGIPLLIDDRLDVAMAVGADGVHLGQSDMPVSIARRIAGPDIIIGATAKTVPQAREAWEQGADYLGVGAIFPTTTKVKTVLTSVDTLRDICAAVPIPANAIGGLNAGNIDILRGVPVAGVCVVSAIMKSPDPEQAARGLLEAIDRLGIGGGERV